MMSKATANGSNGDTTSGDRSLLEYLDLPQLNCLNEAEDHTLTAIVGQKSRNSSSRYLMSDADEQLLLNIPFNQTVRVRSIVLQASNADQAPRTIKLLINRPSLGFEDVDSAETPDVAQILELSAQDVREGNHISLRFVRFQAVNSLHIFVASNQGREDETRIDALDVFGVPLGTTRDLSGLKKQEE